MFEERNTEFPAIFAAPYSGLLDVMAEFQRGMAIAVGVPMRLLFVTQLHATAGPDVEDYYARITARMQNECWQPKLDRIQWLLSKAYIRSYRHMKGIRRPRFARRNGGV